MWIFCELTIEIFAKMSYIIVKELGIDLIIRQKVTGRIKRPQAKPVFRVNASGRLSALGRVPDGSGLVFGSS